jgi:hypothetical protein
MQKAGTLQQAQPKSTEEFTKKKIEVNIPKQKQREEEEEEEEEPPRTDPKRNPKQNVSKNVPSDDDEPLPTPQPKRAPKQTPVPVPEPQIKTKVAPSATREQLGDTLPLDKIREIFSLLTAAASESPVNPEAANKLIAALSN